MYKNVLLVALASFPISNLSGMDVLSIEKILNAASASTDWSALVHRIEVTRSLMRACEDGAPGLITTCLNARADANINMGGCDTPLVKAIRHASTMKNAVECCMLLLDHGADINGLSGSGEYPLLTAAREGRLRLVTFLLERGAKVSVCDSLGQTPLMMAAQGGHSDVFKLLLDFGADALGHDTKGMTAFMHALIHEKSRGLVPHDSIVRYLLRYAVLSEEALVCFFCWLKAGDTADQSISISSHVRNTLYSSAPIRDRLEHYILPVVPLGKLLKARNTEGNNAFMLLMGEDRVVPKTPDILYTHLDVSHLMQTKKTLLLEILEKNRVAEAKST